MRIHIRHVTRYDYEPAPLNAALRVKLFPASFESQRLASWSVRVNGEEIDPLIVNAFGDREGLWTTQTPVDALEIVAEGIVETTETAGMTRGVSEVARPGVFLRTTPLTIADAAIIDLAHSALRSASLETAHLLCQRVRDAIDYVSDTTHAQTGAADALKLGRGVCQDHAHVFIAAARSLEMPARYVTGYLAHGGIGRQETHAWAEVFVSDLGWVGFDPANQQCPTEAYVRLCSGLDARDAAPVRGCVGGHESERLSIFLDVAQDAGAQQQ